MFENFIKTKEMSSEELSEFKQYCEETENLILDEEKEYTSEFWQSEYVNNGSIWNDTRIFYN